MLFLAERKLRFEAVVIGGTALNLLGVVSRPTNDCDVLIPPIPPPVLKAARDLATRLRSSGETLEDDWLNNGPSDVATHLPDGWEARVIVIFTGIALRLSTLERSELLLTKLFALCDRALDLADCLALVPTRAELDESIPWISAQDANPDWPEHVRETLADLSKRLGHAV